ncbi:acyl-CoA dehydrogenase [Alcanivorax sp. N3-2A]|nr:acyl-CoA dehydrogenase [Alcanivorax sp. N3-2A]|tara:strand:+ start:13198 stop:14367 length:1170 start_codon:yes stop_codon:yes gene_type:complete
MDLSFSEEQNMLQESVSRLVRDHYSFQRRQQRLEDGEDLWLRFAELGWLAVPFGEDQGGIGGSAVDVGIVMEGIGRALAVEPYLPHMLASQLLARLAPEPLRDRYLSPALSGDCRLALAFIEAGGRYCPWFCATSASESRGGYQINGAKDLVPGGQSADAYLVIARSHGDTRDRHGLSLFLVEREHPGLQVRRLRTNDAAGAVQLTFENLRLGAGARLGDADQVWPELEHTLDLGAVYQAWEAVGAMAALSEVTLDYLKTRKQFGRPLGANQALQHRMVDLFIAVEEARSSALCAALAMDTDDADERRRNVSLSKIAVDRCARLVGQEAVQLHGAMGVTDELSVGHYFKRLTAIIASFGDSEWHARRIHRLDTASLSSSSQPARSQSWN